MLDPFGPNLLLPYIPVGTRPLRNTVHVDTLDAARLDLVAEPASVAQARAFVVEVLSGWGHYALLDAAALLTSELATNVVLHAQTPYAVVITRTPRGAQVDVLDGADSLPLPRISDVHAATGRGLALVESFSVTWGATPKPALHGFAKGVRFVI